MRARSWLFGLLLLALTSCGGGSVSVGVDVDGGGLRFILWTGNFNADRILDADNQTFAFYIDSGCLHNFQTGRRNDAFCIVSGETLIRYEGFFIRIVNIRSSTGECVSALVDDVTTRFVDIDVDGTGREVVFITPLQPVLCII
ncbi:MAG: hypothetical protein ACO1NO_08785 [Burkholderiaceae bacterium]